MMNRRVSVFLSVVLLVVLNTSVLAGPVGKNTARVAAKKWLGLNSKPMGRAISGRIKSYRLLADPNGLELCHVFDLDRGGFVVVSADDQIEPVIAFSQKGVFNASDKNPLVVLLRRDMPHRLKHAGKNKSLKLNKQSSRWKLLRDAELSPAVTESSVALVSDVRVDSFLPTRWSQQKADGSYCYNYYTPEHYPAGCVATAMAQLMRYHEWPQTGIGYSDFTIKVDGSSRTVYTMGGNGSGGAYDWSQMPYVPSNGLTTQQRQAIGRLLYDAGASVEMSYWSDGSAASLYYADHRLADTFKFSNSIYTGNFSSSGDSTSWAILNSNLNAKMPVILGIRNSTGGHAVVADGYGYIGGTQYHHINLGWGGYDDAWYSLPEVDTAIYSFDVLDECIYNVYPSGTGEIISGQVLSLAGDPISGAAVKAYNGAVLAGQTVTDARGIYAIVKLASDRQYNIVVEKAGQAFTSRDVSVSKSKDYSSCGNIWDADFVSTNQSPPSASDSTVVVDAGGFADIVLAATDDGLPAPSQISYTVVSLPEHGIMSDPYAGGAVIESVPYTLANNGNVIRYTPCPSFGGEDIVRFYADDGGTAPGGGVSNTAALTVEVNNTVYSEIGVDSNTYFNGFMLDTASFYAAKTQVLYLKSEIGEARDITDISIRIDSAPGGTLDNWTVRMQNTSISSFYNPSKQFFATGWTTVYQGDLTISGGGWLNLKFDTPFRYNGTKNLLIDFTFSNTALTPPQGSYFIYDGGATRSLTLMSNSSDHENPLLWDDWYGKSYSTGSELPSIKINGTIAVDGMAGDVDDNCYVCTADLVEMAKSWASQAGDANYDDRCDMATPKNSRIDLADFAVMTQNWLTSYWD